MGYFYGNAALRIFRRAAFFSLYQGVAGRAIASIWFGWVGLEMPAPGFRDAGSNGRLGALAGVGDGGYSWFSSFSGTSGVFLTFGTQSLNPSSVSNPGHGLQLRCLSHPQGVLLAASTLKIPQTGSRYPTKWNQAKLSYFFVLKRFMARSGPSVTHDRIASAQRSVSSGRAARSSDVQ